MQLVLCRVARRFTVQDGGGKLEPASAPSTKQAILYSTARINEARQRRTAKEQLEATGQDAMWGDADEAFDLQLENFGVDTEQLSAPVPRRLFRAWLEGWEKEVIKKPCPVAEARLLEKYKSKLFQAI